MKTILLALFLFILAGCTTSATVPATTPPATQNIIPNEQPKQTATLQHQLEAAKLLDISGTQAAMEVMMNLQLAEQLRQNPELVPYESIIRAFLNKYLGYENIKPYFITMYTEAFTEDEIKEINTFYTTPTGQKAIKSMPGLMQKGGELGIRIVQENLDELTENIRKEAESLQLLDEQ